MNKTPLKITLGRYLISSSPLSCVACVYFFLCDQKFFCAFMPGCDTPNWVCGVRGFVHDDRILKTFQIFVKTMKRISYYFTLF